MTKIKNIKLPHTIVDEGSNVEADGYFINIIRKIIIFVGVNVVDQGYTVNSQLIIMIFMSHTLILSFIFKIFSDSSFGEKLEALCLITAVIQGVHKLYTIVLYPSQFNKLFAVVRNLHKLYLDNSTIAVELKKICVHCTMLFEFFSISFFSIAVAYLSLPIFIWHKYGLLTTIFPIQFPFIDWHTPIGYTSNIINHFYCVTVGLAGIMSADFIFMYFVLHSIGYLNIFKYRVDKLDKMLENEPRDERTIQAQLYECIRAHQDYMSYIEAVNRRFSQMCLTQMVSDQILLTLSLFLILWRNWIVGPFITISALFQLAQYCGLGTVVTIQNEKASEIIYGMSWYLLPVKQQKLIVLMILRGQSPVELNVGSFAKLNVATFMQILKATYSYLMMMLKFLD